MQQGGIGIGERAFDLSSYHPLRFTLKIVNQAGKEFHRGVLEGTEAALRLFLLQGDGLGVHLLPFRNRFLICKIQGRVS